MIPKNVLEGIKEYRFEFKHLTVLFVVLMVFQLLITIVQEDSLDSFLSKTQDVLQKDSAERTANLTSASLELLLENVNLTEIKSEYDRQKIIQSFNIILSQQQLQQNVEEICLFLDGGDSTLVIDDGKQLFDYFSGNKSEIFNSISDHTEALTYFKELAGEIREKEHIYSKLVNRTTFHIFVPFVPNGEYIGVLYMRKTPDLSNLTNEITSSYDIASLIYSSLIILGLLAMYYISSFTVRERDDVRQKLFVEKENHLKEQINHEKESLFTKRIYHTHHKAEKVMGFIKDDLRKISAEGNEEFKYRVRKYSNFISRVIYDMKWYDVPIQTISNQMFNTNVNEVIQFLVQNIFLRIASSTEAFNFETDFDENLPNVPIDEFVVWEILEPLIQNSIDHSNVDKI
ncbi:MAG: histidine kinase, partial [Melioribacteraceae bacterium]|nr:histidine kinase [Melioribacteraceae bacterium]